MVCIAFLSTFESEIDLLFLSQTVTIFFFFIETICDPYLHNHSKIISLW
jgi:hypothetical protein